jgi:hypothetical protein
VSTAAQSNSELIAAYLDAVIRKDALAVDRYFDPDVEYMVNGTAEPDAAGALPPVSEDCLAALSRGWVSTMAGRPSRASSRICIETLRSQRSARAKLFRKEIRRRRLAGSGYTLCPQAEPPTFPTRSFSSYATV